MSKNINKELLTLDLYTNIYDEKKEKIMNLSEKRQLVINELNSLKSQLEEVRAERAQIDAIISNLEIAIDNKEDKKYSLTREMKREIKLSNKLNKRLISECSQYIDVNKFCSKKEETKKR